ncbi:unnamed protein product [Amoebophrya sp. A25]|nr:unnamed protein product [Amoebophrya sp. A25]|eukprot:GSA25T00025487001.1
MGSKHSVASNASGSGAGGVRRKASKTISESGQKYHHGVGGDANSPSVLRTEAISHLENAEVVVSPPATRDRSRLSAEEQADVELGVASLSRVECMIVVVVTLGTLLTNLAIAVAVGIVMSQIDQKYHGYTEGKKVAGVDVEKGDAYKIELRDDAVETEKPEQGAQP